MIDLEAVIQHAHELQPMPASAKRLSELLADPDSDISQFVEVISLDQALTVKLLARANSAASGAREGISTVQAAVVRLGLGTVHALAVAAGAKDTLKKPVPEYGLAENAMWEHSVAAALAAEALPRVLRRAMPDETFTAALLHDIGKVVMAADLTPEVVGFVGRAHSEGHLEPFAAEYEICQAHHGEVGGLVAHHWQLPEGITQGIIHHHTPSEAPPEGDCQTIAHAVCLCDVIAQRIGYALSMETMPEESYRPSMEFFDMDDATLEAACERTNARMDDVGGHYA